MYKKTIALVLSALLLFGAVACTSAPAKATDTPAASQTAASQPEAAQKLHIVTTIFPIYDWVREILGDNPGGAELTMLLDSGVDLHSFQPTASDIVDIATCDIFLYVGGESDEWVENALKENENPNRVVLNLLALLGDAVKEEEIVEGMEADRDHDHDGNDDREHDEDEVEYDEHVWLSLKNAAVLTERIADAVATADAANAETYRKNAAAYIEKLNALDKAYSEAVNGASYKTVLFGDRFPFRYMADDYGLSYYAAFVGCSAETGASFQTIVFLAQKLDELGLPAILQIESADGSIAKTINEATQSKTYPVLTMDSLQSVTATDIKAGISYLAVMENNLTILKAAIGAK